MDKFLSKKHAIFSHQSETHDRHQSNQSIVQMVLKTCYEMARE